MTAYANKRGFAITVNARFVMGFMALSLPLLIWIILLLLKVDYVVNLNNKIHSENLPPILDSQIYQTQDILEHWAMTGSPKDKIHFAHIWRNINKVRAQWNQVIHSLDNKEFQQEWDKLEKLWLLASSR